MVAQAVTQAERRVRTRSWRKVSEGHEDLVAEAGKILRRNDMGGWTRAAPELYPHQWSWDSAFIAIGLAHLDTSRAAQELRTLFAHQWKTGKVPHIVFNPKAPPDSYYPGAEHWACAASSPDAPQAPAYTSCLCQPPVPAAGARHRRLAYLGNGRARGRGGARGGDRLLARDLP